MQKVVKLHERLLAADWTPTVDGVALGPIGSNGPYAQECAMQQDR